MATHSSGQEPGTSTDRGAWRAPVHGVAELDMTEWLSHTGWEKQTALCMWLGITESSKGLETVPMMAQLRKKKIGELKKKSKELRLSLLTNDKIFYTGTPKEAMKKLHLDKDSSKIVAYKVNV